MKRREFGMRVAGALATPALLVQRSAAQNSQEARISIGGDPQAKPLEVGMLLYPGLTLLDLIGPHTVLSPHSNIHLVWKTRDMILSDSGIGVQPTATFDECPSNLDVLFAPGGFHMSALNEPAALA